MEVLQIKDDEIDFFEDLKPEKFLLNLRDLLPLQRKI